MLSITEEEYELDAKLSMVEELLAISNAENIPILNSVREEMAKGKAEREKVAELREEYRKTYRKAVVMTRFMEQARKQFQEISKELIDLESLPCNQAKKLNVATDATKISGAAASVPATTKTTKPAGVAAAVGEKKLPQSALVTYPTTQEFMKIPKYMKGKIQSLCGFILAKSSICYVDVAGRLTYEGLTTTIDEFNKTLVNKYNFLLQGFKAMSSLANKKKYKVMYIR